MGIGGVESDVGDNEGLTDPHRQLLKARRGVNGLAMNRSMTGEETLRHRDLQHQNLMN
jgi:hypothetical protein